MKKSKPITLAVLFTSSIILLILAVVYIIWVGSTFSNTSSPHMNLSDLGNRLAVEGILPLVALLLFITGSILLFSWRKIVEPQTSFIVPLVFCVFAFGLALPFGTAAAVLALFGLKISCDYAKARTAKATALGLES